MSVNYAAGDPLDERADLRRNGGSAAPRVELVGEGDQIVRAVELSSAGLTVGRAPGNNIVLDYEQIGRYHLRIDWDGSYTTVTDLGARAGTLLNGQRIPPHTPQAWQAGTTLQIGPQQLRQSRQGGSAPAGFAPASGPAAKLGVALELGKDALELIPGEPAVVNVIVKNHDTSPKNLIIAIEGAGAAWAQAPAAPIALRPGGETSIPLRVLVPRSSESRAGQYPITIRVRAQEHPDESSVVTARWTVQAFAASALELHPRKRSARGTRQATYSVVLLNTGNVTTYYDLRAGEDEPALEYELGQPRVVVEPGTQASIRLEVQARERPTGKSQTHNFSVRATPANGPAQIDSGQFVHIAGMPGWIVPAALAGFMLLLLALAVLSTRFAAVSPVNASAPSATPINTPTPTNTLLPGETATAEPVDTAATQQGIAIFAAQVAQTAAAQVFETAQGNREADAQSVQTVAAMAGQTAGAQVFNASTAQANMAAAVESGQALAVQAGQAAAAEAIQNAQATNVAAAGDPTVIALLQTVAALANPPSPTPSPTPTETPSPSPTEGPVIAIKLIFQVSPGDSSAGKTFPNQIVVIVTNDAGAVATTANLDVQLSIKPDTNKNNAKLLGPTKGRAVNGVATFSGLSIDKIGDYQLTATANAAGLREAYSDAFKITSNTPTQLKFDVQPPPNAIAGQPFLVSVQVLDASGNVATFNDSVTLSIQNNPGQGTLGSQNLSITPIGGVATFAGLTIDKVGRGYTLQVAASSLTPATSQAFNVLPQKATQLVFTTSPANTPAKAPLTIVIEARDDFNNLDTTFIGPISLGFQTNLTGATLAGTTSISATAGIARFGAGQNVAIDRIGQNYVLQASGINLRAGLSGPFNITASRLRFFLAPADTRVGSAFAQQPVVWATDEFGQVIDPGFNGTVTLAIKSGAGAAGAAMGPAVNLRLAAVNGIADWTGKNLNIDHVGQGYVLTATSGALSSSPNNDSAPFNISADRLKFIAAPGDTPAGGAFAQQPIVIATDQFGQVVDTTFNGQVGLAIKAGAGVPGAALGPNASLNATQGVADFKGSGLNIDHVGQGYLLTASAAGLTSADSSPPFKITASQLQITFAPANTRVGAAFAIQPIVKATDNAGNVDPTFVGSITISIKSGTGTAGALIGPANRLTVAAIGGIATFSGLSIDHVGQGYVLTATSGSLTSSPNFDSAAFNISADRLKFIAAPGNTPAGVAFAQQPIVIATDQFGQVVDTTFNGSVTLRIKTGTAGATLGPAASTTLVATNGVANFAGRGLNIDRIGQGYALTASSAGLTSADSSAFNITANQLRFSASPGNARANAAFAQQPVVIATDATGAIDTTFDTINVTLSIQPGTGASGAVVGPPGNLTVATVRGTANFNGRGLNIDRIGQGYVLVATSGLLSSSPNNNSRPFNITADRLSFTVSPGNMPANTAFTRQPIVAATDAFGNVDSTFNNVNLTVAIKANTGTPNANLSGARSQRTLNGIADFAGRALRIDHVGQGYVLTASANGLAGDSAAFNITADRLKFIASPGNTPLGQPFAQQPIVIATDGFGVNADLTFSGAVTLALKPGNCILGFCPSLLPNGNVTIAATQGRADFAAQGLFINLFGTNYQLAASSGALTSTPTGDSARFNIN